MPKTIEKTLSKDQDLLQSKKIDIGMDDLRSYLWCPRYAKWVVQGGFDYRNHVRRAVRANLAKILDSYDEGRKTFDPIMVNRIDFPPSMGNVNRIICDFIEGVIKEFKFNYSITANVMKSYPISVADAAQYDIMTKVDDQENDKLEAFFFDPFPPDNLWASTPLEKKMMSYLGSYYSDMTSDMLEIEREKLTSAVLCSSNLYCQIEESNLLELKRIIEAALKDQEGSVTMEDPSYKTKLVILEKELEL